MSVQALNTPITMPHPKAHFDRLRPITNRRPRIVVSGSDQLLVRRVARTLDRLRVDVLTKSWEELLEVLDSRVAAVVLVQPIRKISNATAVEILRDHPHGKQVPIFFVVPDRATSRSVRQLYQNGVTTVFAWPHESKILSTLFAEAFGIVRVRGRSPEGDKALARTVRAHLRLGASRGVSGLRLFARDGLISISGQTPTLAQRWEIIETAAAVPGVRSVIAESLRVVSGAVSNRVLSQRIRRLIQNTVDLEPAVIEVTVENGSVRLSGKTDDRAEVKRLIELISNLKGVRELDLDITVSTAKRQRDSRAAKRLRRSLSVLYPKEKLTLLVVDGIGVVSGRVRTLSIKRSIDRLLQSDNDIRRVVNKIQVVPSGRA